MSKRKPVKRWEIIVIEKRKALYEVEARDEDEAREKLYEDAKDYGHTMDCQLCDIESVKEAKQ